MRVSASSPAGIPQRAYQTGVMMLLAGVLMFFMALVSAEIVRRGFSSDWQPLDLPWRILELSTAILLASSFTLARSRNRLLRMTTRDFAIGGVSQRSWEFFFSRGSAPAGINSPSQELASRQIRAAAFSMYLLLRTRSMCSAGIAVLVAVALRAPRHLSRATVAGVVSTYWRAINALWVLLFLLLFLQK